jgi:hypothetical protein
MSETLATHNTISQQGTLPLHTESAQNTINILGKASNEFARVGFLSPTEFDNQIPERTEAIEAHQHTSINMSVESLGRMLENGSHESAWSHLREVGLENMDIGNTAQGKSFHEGYFEHRATVETQLADYVEEPGNREPIYAAVASNEDEHLYGACPEYGDVSVILDESAIDPNSTVYAWSDSLISSIGSNEQGEITIAKPQVLTKEDAMVAKAVVDMSEEYGKRFSKLGHARGPVILEDSGDQDKLLSLRGGYIETVLFQDVTPDMIQAVSVAGNMDDTAKAVNAIKEHPEIAEKAIFVTQDGQSELIKDYLATHFSTVEKAHGSVSAEQHVVDPERWTDLGVDASAEPSAIRQALVSKALGLLQSRSELSRLAVFSSAGERMDTARGMKQVLNSIRGSITKSPAHDQLRQQYKEALIVQEALRFFEAITPQKQPRQQS